MLIGPRALKSLKSIEKIQPRMMVATFKVATIILGCIFSMLFNDGNPSATIIYYSPTNVSKETDLIAFYDELSSFVTSQNTTFSSLAEI